MIPVYIIILLLSSHDNVCILLLRLNGGHLTKPRLVVPIIALLFTLGCSSLRYLPDAKHTLNQFDNERTARPEAHRRQPKVGTWQVLAYQGCCEANTQVVAGPPPALWHVAYPAAGSTYPSCATTVTCNSINTIKESYTALPSHSISVTFTITASPGTQFYYQLNSNNTCINNAQMRLFFQRRDDNGTMAYGRWYSLASYVIYPTSGQAVFTVPLTGSQWSSVYGESGGSGAGAAGFTSALHNLGYVGLVDGGGCFAAHGVSASNSSAQLTLFSYSVL